MTLYQRIYSTRSKKEAQRAWFYAGLFEWPVMAMMGVLLGLFSRVALENGMFTELGYSTLESIDSEMGLPLLLRSVLPVGLMGLMMSAYFSAIMSTADSCLMAASGNVVSDIIGYFKEIDHDSDTFLRFSQITTLVIGVVALLIATTMNNVLQLMLKSYAFMVSGLFVPIIGALFWKKSSSVGAIAAMILGGATTVSLDIFMDELPAGLDANVFGIATSLVVFVGLSLAFPDEPRNESRMKETQNINATAE